MANLSRIVRKRRGQSMTEYIIIVVLIAIAVLAGVLLFGKVLEQKYWGADVRVDELEVDAN